MKRITAVLVCIALPATICLSACSQNALQRPSPVAREAAKEPAPEPVIERGTVRQIRLPEIAYELPPGKGRETVVVQCAVCHSLAYIPLQPPLSRDAWTASVTKMQKTYSAPIPEEKVPEIIDYLVAVNGKK